MCLFTIKETFLLKKSTLFRGRETSANQKMLIKIIFYVELNEEQLLF